MILRQALRIDESICIAIVGAGGKTTLMFRLGRQFPSPVIVTTTTHLGIEQIKLADQHFYIDSPDDLAFIECNMPSGITLVTGPKVEDRVSGLNQESLLALQEAARKKRLPLLIEADGSRCLPL
ncbi:MAG: hypothetical protein IT308_13215, partial [Anaerolineaceae bacterium]|nr:hypothetical protein [Anaerolineaceae bacterium]